MPASANGTQRPAEPSQQPELSTDVCHSYRAAPGRSRFPIPDYDRSAATGSIAVARRAGTQLAITATHTMSSATAP